MLNISPKPYRNMYVPPQKVGVFEPFWSENGYGLCGAHFGLESGMVFEGTTGVYERVVSIPHE